MADHKYAGMSVREILELKKASVQRAPLPPGTPDWADILALLWEDVDSAAKASQPGFKTIRKLLTDSRFDK